MSSILLLINSLGIGGAQRQLILLASGLQNSGYPVKLALAYAGGPQDADVGKNIPIVVLTRKAWTDRRGIAPWVLISFFFRLIGLVRRERPSVLYSYLPVSNVWAALVKLIVPHTKVVWGVRASNVDMTQYPWQIRLAGWVESRLAGIPDWIICNSWAGFFHAVRRGFPQAKISVVPNAVDTTRFYPERKSGLRLREQWGLRPDHKLIGIVGRIDPMKDYPNFLRTASLLVRERSDVRFLCVGGGEHNLMVEYQQLARELKLDPFLTWVGARSDIFNVYNALDLLVSSSSLGEGFSNVVSEAMACGVPCAATDVGDARRLIGPFGEIAPPGNPEALKKAILVLLEKMEKEGPGFNRKVAQRINEQFGVSALVQNTVKILNNLS